MGTDDLQKAPAAEQIDIPGRLTTPGMAVLALIYTWS